MTPTRGGQRVQALLDKRSLTEAIDDALIHLAGPACTDDEAALHYDAAISALCRAKLIVSGPAELMRLAASIGVKAPGPAT